MIPTINIAFSKDKTKIGCPIAQAFHGGEVTHIAPACFDTELWEINPGDCQLFSLPLDNLPDAVERLGGSRRMAQNIVDELTKEPHA